MRKFAIIPLIIILYVYSVVAQQECIQSSSLIIGADLGIERGYTLTPSADGNGYYVGGFKNDSLTLLRVDLDGSVLWNRSFDISSGLAAHVTRILLDSEGMVVLAGNHGGFPNGNSVFIIRYDPNVNQVLWSRRYSLTSEISHYSLLQKGPGGNYVFSLSTVYPGTDDSNVIEVDKNNGDLVDPFYVEFDLGASDGLAEIVYHEGFIYGTGRYTDGGSPADMRHTVVKLNGDDGTQVWVRMGHRAANQTARLYGADLTIYQDKIYTIYFGDPDGTSLTENLLYIQATNLDGDLLWLRSYMIPGSDGDAGVEIISSDGGLVVLAKKRFATPRLVLFKVNPNGELLWSHAYLFTGIITNFADIENARSSQLIEVNNNLIFTGYGNNNTGGTNMVVVTTNLEGEISDGCLENNPIQMSSAIVTNPVFYAVNPAMALVPPDVIDIPVTIHESPFLLQCAFTDTVPKIFILNKNICHNESFEGYTISGTYRDTFSLVSGCDSVRILNLTVLGCVPVIHYDLNACVAYMHNGTNMDYSEFTPAYPELACAVVEADILHRTNTPDNKHSCTPGVNDSDAMCVSSSASCTYTAGHEASVIIEFSVDPFEDSLFTFSKLEFYEKAPNTYVWLDGPTGPNNYPLRYGIRILKNGVEIFRNEAVSTNLTWTLQSFDFIDNDLFKVEGFTNFRIELLPYCPVGNGAVVSAWDIDEVRIYAACAPLEKDAIKGQVNTKDGRHINGVEIHMTPDHGNSDYTLCYTHGDGTYQFDNIKSDIVFLNGYKNDHVLNGVSTLDLVYIQKHLLGLSEFTSLAEYVAADINYSYSISAVDLLELRKVLLGINKEFPRNTSWRFGTMNQDWNGKVLTAFKESEEVHLKNDTHFVDFMGIKIGDLNGDVQVLKNTDPIQPRSNDELVMTMDDIEMDKDEIVSVHIKAKNNVRMVGMQMAFDLEDLEVVEIKPGMLNFSSDNFNIDGGQLKISWNESDEVRLAGGNVLFTILARAHTTTSTGSAIRLSAADLKSEYYSPDLTSNDIVFNLEKEKDTMSQNISLQIEPNPVHNEANIQFKIVQDAFINIRFYNMAGQLMYSFNKLYKAGNHQELVDSHQLKSKGMMYCQVISDSFTRVKAFVIAE